MAINRCYYITLTGAITPVFLCHTMECCVLFYLNTLLMTKLRQIFSFAALTFCLTTSAQPNSTNLKIDSTKEFLQFKQKDTAYWVDNFRQFRDALYKNDKSKAKEFLDFPFRNEGNEIWYLAYSDNEKVTNKLNQTLKPFTEIDFDKYFGKIFTTQLVKCFLKIKVDDLYKNGKSQSPEIKDSLNTYKLYTTYDKVSKTIELNFATNTPYKISDTEYEAGEANFIYQFVVLKNGHIKLKRILIAG